jgi:CHASE3 domain sensor protein
MIAAIVIFLVLVVGIVLASVRRSSQISREEEEDDSFDYGALESDLQNHIADLNVHSPSR